MPEVPTPGAAVPFNDELCDAIDAAADNARSGKWEEAGRILNALLDGDEMASHAGGA